MDLGAQFPKAEPASHFRAFGSQSLASQVVRGAGVPGRMSQQGLSGLWTSGLSHLGATHLASSQELPMEMPRADRTEPLWLVGGN